jgi:histone acetyltransferase (RNA polymerase elongator complex component)
MRRPLIIPFFIPHQGCPHQCVFCNQTRISGGRGFPSPDELYATIAAYRASAGGASPEVAFYGGTFTSLPRPDQEELLQPLQPLLARGEIGQVRVSTRPDAIDAEVAEFLLQRGVRTVELGAQSMADDVLALSGRGHTADHVRAACRTLRGAGLAVGVQLMPGLPGGTAAEALMSLDAVLALRPDFLRIYPTLVVAGTKLATHYRDGAYLPLSLAEAVRLCKIMLHAALAADIRVIRIGLQPTAELASAGTVLAGPYHPAFRQLVESELYYDLLAKLTREVPSSASVTVSCAPSRLSDIAGQRRGNLLRLAGERGVRVAAIRADPDLLARQIRVEFSEGTRKGDIVHDLDYTSGGDPR